MELFRGVNMDFYTFLLNLILSFSICNKFKINVFIKIQTFYVDIIIVKNNLFLHKHVTRGGGGALAPPLNLKCPPPPNKHKRQKIKNKK